MARRAFVLSIVTLAAALALPQPARAAGWLQSLVSGSDKPVVLEPATDLAGAAKAVFQKPSSLDEVRGNPGRIGISAFQLRFVTDSGISSKRGNASASVDYKLEVPPVEVFQRLTDGMRAQFEAALAARGYTVLPAEALLADADFARRAAEAPRAVDSGPNVFSRNGHVEVNARHAADTFGVTQGGAEMGLAERLGADVALVKVQLKIDFASLESMGLLEGGGAAGVKSKVGLSLWTEGKGFSSNGVTVVTGRGAVPNSLLKPVYMTQPFAKSVDKVNESTGQAVAGFLMSLAGGSSASARYVVTPADDYEAQMAAACAQVAQLLAASFPARAATAPLAAASAP